MSIEYVGDGSPDGTIFGQSGEKIAFLGGTPIAQKSVNATVTSVDPTVSGCAFLASVQSIAVYAASQINVMKAAMQSYGLLG